MNEVRIRFFRNGNLDLGICDVILRRTFQFPLPTNTEHTTNSTTIKYLPTTMATPAASQENELRQRKGASNKRTSTTDLPWKSPSGHLILEDTPIPKQRKRPSYDNLVDSERNLLVRPILTDSDATQDLTDSASKGGPRKAMSGDAVKKDERRGTKVFVRLVSGLAMVGFPSSSPSSKIF